MTSPMPPSGEGRSGYDAGSIHKPLTRPLPNASPREWALYYAGLGWRVFPLQPGGRKPLNPDGLTQATTDPVKVERWWRERPDANIGIATGLGLVVLEIDPRKGGNESYENLQKKYSRAFRQLAKVRSDDGSTQLYFALPDGTADPVASVLPGITFKVEGDYVLAPPSRLDGGGCNHWASAAPIEPPVLPEELRDFFSQAQTAPAADRLGSSGNSRAIQEKPLEKDEVVLEDETRRAREEVPDCSGANPGSQPLRQGKVGVSFSAKHLMKKDLRQLRPVIHGLVHEGLTVLAAKPKMGKSWTVLTAGVAIATGSDALGCFPTEKGSVFYIALEDSERRLKDRLDRILDGAEPPDDLEFATEWPRFDQDGLHDLDVWLANHPSTVAVFIDTFAKVCPVQKVGRNAYHLDYETLGAIKKIADKHHVAIVLVHHTNKLQKADDPFDKVSGSTGIIGAADTILLIDRKGTTKADAVLYVRGRDIEEQDLALKHDESGCGWRVVGEAEALRQSLTRQRIVQALREANEPLTPSDIAAKTAMSANNVKQHLRRMRDEGQVRQPSDGHYELVPK